MTVGAITQKLYASLTKCSQCN